MGHDAALMVPSAQAHVTAMGDEVLAFEHTEGLLAMSSSCRCVSDEKMLDGTDTIPADAMASETSTLCIARGPVGNVGKALPLTSSERTDATLANQAEGSDVSMFCDKSSASRAVKATPSMDMSAATR